MPMIGGEMAEQPALARRPVTDDVRDPHDLGWVVDWLYGDAALPPMPLPPEPDVIPFRRRVTAPAPAAAVPAEPRRARKSPRRARQLVLL